ncbi:MAG: hypothetical protein ABEH59_06470 [Halobacteriales archaeon]
MATERDRGILTKVDRRFLTGEDEVNPETARSRRHRIRGRVFHAIQDTWLLLDYLEDRDLTKIFDKRRWSAQSERDIAAPYRFLWSEYRYPLSLTGEPRPDRLRREPAAENAYKEALIDYIAFGARMIDTVEGLSIDEIVEAGLTKYLIDRDRTASVETQVATWEDLQTQWAQGDINVYECKWLLRERE